MFRAKIQSWFADGNSAPALIRRLLFEQAARQRKRYAQAFALMAVGALATGLGAYLIGDVINQAYVHHNLPGIVTLGIVTAVIFMVKAMATYLSAVKLSQIANSIIANNQRRIFTALIHQNLAYFADRHSSEFLARLTTGAAAASQALNLVIGAVGRDLLSLIALVTVMVVQDPVMSFITFFIVPPAFYFLRKMIRRISTIAKRQFTGGTHILETMQETLQGIRIVKAFTLEDAMRARLRRQCRQSGAGIEPLGAHRPSRRPVDGGARRLRHCHCNDLRRLPRDQHGSNARPVLLLPRRLHAGL